MSNPFTFSTAARLTAPADFARVFAAQRKIFTSFFVVYYCETQSAQSRIGIITSKRAARRAHQRNHIRRLVREFFRLQRYRLHKPLDIVIIARHSAANAGNAELNQCLDYLWKKLNKA